MDFRKALFTVAVTVALILAAQQPSGGQQAPTGPTITFQGREIPNTVEEILNPKHTVLVVHEMLNDFISEGGASDNARRTDQCRLDHPADRRAPGGGEGEERPCGLRPMDQARGRLHELRSRTP